MEHILTMPNLKAYLCPALVATHLDKLMLLWLPKPILVKVVSKVKIKHTFLTCVPSWLM